MPERPRVSIGVTAYNNERYLRGALDAVLAQDFTDFEVVICDNQSTDATWEICQTYADKDNRFRIFRNPQNIGLAGNFRRVLELCRGDYFRWTAHDDLMAPTLLSRCVAALDHDPEAVLAYPQGIVIDDDGRELFDCEDEPDIRERSPARRIAHAMKALRYCNSLFGVMRIDVLRRTQMVGQLNASDNRLLIELAARGGFHLVPERLFYRRSHEQSSFGGARDRRQRYEWLEPDVVDTRTRRSGSDMEWLRLTRQTIGVLARNELPLPTRVATTATFCVVWTIRLARPPLGRLRARITRRPVAAPAPGERMAR